MKQDVGRTARADGPGAAGRAVPQPMDVRRAGRRGQWGGEGPCAAAGGAVFERGAAPGRRARGAPSRAEQVEAARPGLLTPSSAPRCRASPSRGGSVTVKVSDVSAGPGVSKPRPVPVALRAGWRRGRPEGGGRCRGRVRPALGERCKPAPP